jgi:hypothetical protein
MTRVTTPWDGATELFRLDPGTVTLLASLPTAGRSTLALNIAMHAGSHGHGTLYSSAESSADIQQEKVFAARYGVDTRRPNLSEVDWEELKRRAREEIPRMSLICQGTSAERFPRDVFRAGRDEAHAHGMELGLWVLDTIEHCTRYIDGRLDWEQPLHEVRRIALEQQLAVLLTIRVVNDRKDQSIAGVHIPEPVRRAVDTVVALERPGVYWDSVPDSEATQARLFQLKPWPTRLVPLKFQPSFCRFVSPA